MQHLSQEKYNRFSFQPLPYHWLSWAILCNINIRNAHFRSHWLLCKLPKWLINFPFARYSSYDQAYKITTDLSSYVVPITRFNEAFVIFLSNMKFHASCTTNQGKNRVIGFSPCLMKVIHNRYLQHLWNRIQRKLKMNYIFNSNVLKCVCRLYAMSIRIMWELLTHQNQTVCISLTLGDIIV